MTYVAPNGHPSNRIVLPIGCPHSRTGGIANRSREPRPVAYVAFSTRDGVSDAHNFPKDASLVTCTRPRVAVSRGEEETEG